MKESIRLVEGLIEKVATLAEIDKVAAIERDDISELATKARLELLNIRHNLRFAESMSEEYKLTNEVKEVVAEATDLLEASLFVLEEEIEKLSESKKEFEGLASEYFLITSGIDREKMRPVFADYESNLAGKYNHLLASFENELPLLNDIKEASASMILEIGNIINRDEFYATDIKEGDKVVLKESLKHHLGDTIVTYKKGSIGFVNSISSDLIGHQGTSMCYIQLGDEEVVVEKDSLGKLSDVLADMYKELPVKIQPEEFTDVVNDYVAFQAKGGKDIDELKKVREAAGKEFTHKHATALRFFLKQRGAKEGDVQIDWSGVHDPDKTFKTPEVSSEGIKNVPAPGEQQKAQSSGQSIAEGDNEGKTAGVKTAEPQTTYYDKAGIPVGKGKDYKTTEEAMTEGKENLQKGKAESFKVKDTEKEDKVKIGWSQLVEIIKESERSEKVGWIDIVALGLGVEYMEVLRFIDENGEEMARQRFGDAAVDRALAFDASQEKFPIRQRFDDEGIHRRR